MYNIFIIHSCEWFKIIVLGTDKEFFMKDREFYFRHVYIFENGTNYGNGTLLFSFAPQVISSDDSRVILDVREPLVSSGVRQAAYFASCLFDGDAVKILIERDGSPPLVFIKPVPSMGWFLIIDGAEDELISHEGCHSLNMLVSEIRLPSQQEH